MYLSQEPFYRWEDFDVKKGVLGILTDLTECYMYNGPNEHNFITDES